jgi:hypothetical protein
MPQRGPEQEAARQARRMDSDAAELMEDDSRWRRACLSSRDADDARASPVSARVEERRLAGRIASLLAGSSRATPP